MQNNYLVSICIPTYNMGHLIKNAIVSSINQTYKNIEIIISDNNSTDNTFHVVGKYLIDKRVKYYKLPENIGMAANFNFVVTKAKGEIVKFLCADDILDKDVINKSIGIFLNYPEVKLITFNRQIRDIGTNKLTLTSPKQKGMYDGNNIINMFYKNINPIGNPSNVIFYRDDFERLGGFDTSYPASYMNDAEFWLRYINNKDIYFEDFIGVTILNHSERGGIKGMKYGLDVGVNFKMVNETIQRFENIITYTNFKLFYSSTLLFLRFFWRSLQELKRGSNIWESYIWIRKPYFVLNNKYFIVIFISIIILPFYIIHKIIKKFIRFRCIL